MDLWLERIKQMYLKASEALIGGMLGRRALYTPRTVWDLLAAEGNYTLINTLKRAERREPGYGTIIIPEEGYSKDPKTHEAVVKWLKNHGVNSYSPVREICEMERSLHA